QVRLVYKVDNLYYTINSYSDRVNFYTQFPHFKEKYRDNFFIIPNNPGPWSHIDTKEILPSSLLIENTILSGVQNIKAFENITIGNNVQIANGSDINLTAGKLIEVPDLFEGEEMLHLNVGLNPSEIANVCEPMSYLSAPDLDELCANGNKYFERTRILTKTNEIFSARDIEKPDYIGRFNLFPNPAKEYTTLEFDVYQDTKITVHLTSMNGQVLETFATNKYYPIGNFELPLNLKNLSQGVYLVSISEDNGVRKVFKIIKQ
ncbi:MAG: T9SS type A sorting domain-containing protein, partial [Bacteroidia bacterium]|nr:T9SS type A sorting domain-containing protein [Bacteroidia bacterium]